MRSRSSSRAGTSSRTSISSRRSAGRSRSTLVVAARRPARGWPTTGARSRRSTRDDRRWLAGRPARAGPLQRRAEAEHDPDRRARRRSSSSPASSSGSASVTTASSSTGRGRCTTWLMYVSVALLVGHLYLALDPPADAARAAWDDDTATCARTGRASTTRSGSRPSAGCDLEHGRLVPLRRRRRLHVDAARRQPARGLHRRARPRRRDDAGTRARDRVLGDGLRAPGRGATARRGSGSSTRATRCRSQGIRRSGPRSCSPRRSSSGSIRLETGVGTVPVVIERDESGRVVFGRMTQPVPRIEPVERPERVLAAVGAARSLLPVELYDNGARHIVVLVEERRARARCAPTGRRSRRSAVTGVNCVATDGRRAGGAGCSGSTARIRPRGRPPARSPATSRGTASIAWGDEIVIAQGVEMGRPSTLHARAEGGDGLDRRGRGRRQRRRRRPRRVPGLAATLRTSRPAGRARRWRAAGRSGSRR